MVQTVKMNSKEKKMYKSYVTAVCLVLSGLCFADRDKSGGDGLLTNWVEIANSLNGFWLNAGRKQLVVYVEF